MGISSILLFLCIHYGAKATTLFPSSIAVKMSSYTNMNGGFPPVPDDYYSTFGLVQCGTGDGANVFLSNDTTTHSLITELKAIQEFVLDIYLNWMPSTGAELYTVYGHPGLNTTNVICAREAAMGENVISIVSSPGNDGTACSVFQWDITQAGIHTDPQLETIARLYMVCTPPGAAADGPYCWTAKPGENLTLQPVDDGPEQKLAFVFQPVLPGPDPTQDAQRLVEANQKGLDEIDNNDPSAAMDASSGGGP